MEERKSIKPVNWGIRNKAFIHFALKGIGLQQAYDLAMCSMYRAEERALPWGKPPETLLNILKNYEPKEEE